MQEFYEDLWTRLPTDLPTPDLKRRSRLLADHLHRGQSVLDLGCGAGVFTGLIAGVVGAENVIGADVARAALQRARNHEPQLRFEQVPFDGPLPFADNSFELVWASEVIEHVADTARWLSELRRTLKPGGKVLITTPAHGRLRLLLGGIGRYSEPLGDHLHLYDRQTLRQLLEEFGFSEVRVKGLGPPGFADSLHAVATR